MKTTLPVKIVADAISLNGDKFHALLPLTIEIDLEHDVVTLGSCGGPDMWCGKLSDLTGEQS